MLLPTLLCLAVQNFEFVPEVGIILLATNPLGVHARKLRIHKLEKLAQEEDYLHSRLRIAEFQENVLKVNWDLNLRYQLDNDWMVRNRK